MTVQDFVRDVVEENRGFILDEPWRMGEESLSVIIPVKRECDEERDYITLAEAGNVKVEDTGQIDYVYVKNNEDIPLLISRGEIFRGKTQERAAIHGSIIPANAGMRIAVRCIHQSKGISVGAEMKYGGRVPSYVNLSSQSNAWNSIQTRSYSSNSNQNVTYMCNTLKSRGIGDDILGSCELSDMQDFSYSNSSSIHVSDDLVGTLDEMSDMIKEMMKKIPPIKNQVGAIFLHENDIRGLDIYNLPDSWDSVKSDVVEKEGSEYLKKEDSNIFEFKPDKVRSLLSKKLNVKFEEKMVHDSNNCKIIEIRQVLENPKSQRLMGEAVEFNGKIIHLTMYQG